MESKAHSHFMSNADKKTTTHILDVEIKKNVALIKFDF